MSSNFHISNRYLKNPTTSFHRIHNLRRRVASLDEAQLEWGGLQNGVHRHLVTDARLALWRQNVELLQKSGEEMKQLLAREGLS